MVLNHRQRRFAEEYVACGNATRAAVAAGYSARTAGSQAHELLKKPEIQAEVKRLRSELAERSMITAESVVARLAGIGFAELGDYMSWGPGGLDLVDSSELSEGQRAAVESIRVTKQGFVLKLRDATRALELLGRHLGVFDETVQVNVGVDGIDGLLRRLALAVHGEELERALDAGDLPGARRALEAARR